MFFGAHKPLRLFILCYRQTSIILLKRGSEKFKNQRAKGFCYAKDYHARSGTAQYS